MRPHRRPRQQCRRPVSRSAGDDLDQAVRGGRVHQSDRRFHLMREVYTRWMKQNGGAIVNMIADISNGWPNFAHSGASRGGMLTLSESAASEWAAAGVRVNTVAPGAIASSGLDTYEAEHRAYIQNEIACEIPLQRFGTEAEVAAAIVFLLSPAAAFITGS